MIFTPSGLEDYLLCPFRFYAMAILKLEEKPVLEPEMTPREVGIAMHRILEKFLGGRDLSLEHLQDLASSVLDHFQKGRSGLSPPLVERQKRNIQRTLTSFLEREVGAFSEKKGLQPRHLEWSFGEGEVPPLEIPDDTGGMIPIRGRIDRIDVDHEKKRFLVIDYKTGSRKVTGRDLESGKSLALPLYILAVKKILLTGYQPIGGLFFYLSDMTKVSLPEDRWEEASRRVEETVRGIVSGIRQEVFPSRKEACEPFCPFKDVCLLRAHDVVLKTGKSL